MLDNPANKARRIVVDRPIHEIRRENVRALIELAGGPKKFGEAIGKDSSFVSRRAGPRPSSNIGEKLARSIEAYLQLPPFYLDTDQRDPLALVPKKADNVFGTGVSKVAIVAPDMIPETFERVISGKWNPDEVVTVDAVVKGRAGFVAFRVTDSALIKNDRPIPPGATVIVDTKRNPNPGDYVLAINGRKTETLRVREYREASGDKYLYSADLGSEKLEGRWRISGVVTKVQFDLFDE